MYTIVLIVLKCSGLFDSNVFRFSSCNDSELVKKSGLLDSNADIARLGDERIIVTPQGVKIWKPDYDLK